MIRQENSKVKIQKISAGKLYEYLIGVRKFLEYDDAILDDSIFARFLYDSISVNKIGMTRDVVSIDFDMGAQDYEKHKIRIKNRIKETEKRNEQDKVKYLLSILNDIEKNKELYERVKKENLREQWYQNGFDIAYDKTPNGKPYTIHYVRLYRSTGQAKKGTCLFINDKIISKANKFLTMGISFPKDNSGLVSFLAYESLIASHIDDTIKINPKDVLIIKDVDSIFTTNTVDVCSKYDESFGDYKCYVKRTNNSTLKNTLFDGQALLDSSIFPKDKDGYILLRQHFTKCATFKANIQLFFKDYYGNEYDTAQVKDMWGNNHYVKDIKMITTHNAIKWCKYGVSYEHWCNEVNKCENQWGIVKSGHTSKLGDEIQQMSYQMFNSLDIDSVKECIKTTDEYIYSLKADDKAFEDYLRRNANFSNDNEAWLALIEHNNQIINTEAYKLMRKKDIEHYIEKIKRGKVIQNAENLTMVGNPYAMLLCVVGENPEQENIFKPSKQFIECYTPRFKENELLCAFRSPHNSLNGVCCLKNIYNEKIDRYFDISNCCIIVNCIHTDIQDRLNGCDFDSDMIYVTNEPTLVERAKYCYENFPTIVNKIEPGLVIDNDNGNDLNVMLANIDNKLGAAQSSIGESSNLAQFGLTYMYSFDGEFYKKCDDAVCVLGVLAQVAIDAAKRPFKANVTKEVQFYKSEDGLNVEANGRPVFWKRIHPEFTGKINNSLKCPMNELNKIRFKPAPHSVYTNLLDINDFIITHRYQGKPETLENIMSIITEYENCLLYYQINASNMMGSERYDAMQILNEKFDAVIETLKRKNISKGTMSYLVNKAFNNSNDNKAVTRRSTMLAVLYRANPKYFLDCFKKD